MSLAAREYIKALKWRPTPAALFSDEYLFLLSLAIVTAETTKGARLAIACGTVSKGIT